MMEYLAPALIALGLLAVAGSIVFAALKRKATVVPAAFVPDAPAHTIETRTPVQVLSDMAGGAPVTMDAPPEVFVDRDDLMKWIGSSGFDHAVTVDGIMVHGGFGPAVAFYTQANGGLSGIKP